MNAPSDVQQTKNLNTSQPSLLALFPLLLGALLPPLDYFIVNLALFSIRDDIGASDTQLQLVISAYACAYAAGLITGGRLGDRYGRKRIFMLGMVGFLLASLLCGCAPNGTVLIGGRILQGFFASILAPQVLATIRSVYPVHLQTPICAVYGFVFGIAAITGQIGGGILIDLDVLGLGWRAIFLVNLPIGIVALAAALTWVPENRSERQVGFDVLGMLLLTAFLLCFIYPLSRGLESGWPTWLVLMLAASFPILVVFVRLEKKLQRQGATPLVNLDLLRNPVISLGTGLAFLFYSDALFFFGFALYLQSGHGLSALDSGLGLLPFAAGFIIGPLWTPRLVKLIGNNVAAFGFAVLALGFFLLAFMATPDRTLGVYDYLTLLVAGCGHGIVLSSLTRIVLAYSPRNHAGLVSGLLISMLQIGSATGAAVLGGLFFHLLGEAPQAIDYAHAFRDAMYVLAALLTLCIPLGLWLAKLTRHAATD
ncbi:MFS transporter [Pseudomonas sp. MPFS]|uniref:MFS transporter n=1 Tax=Pseudomonas sp. MPFS TaxID=2795724 RepID=UPI001F13ECB2|nr:MFS transporter [Pseudomonas sp. MPFS]UMZ09360.1 MFS transporter [Pseudomonas sp. MPFS]